MQATFTRLETLRIPVIAAIQGGCIGGAVDMVTACCIRYATADAFFCIQEINIGMVADVGTLQRLPKLVPLGVVKELAYTGRRLPAQKALGYGLVNEVFDTQEAMVAAALQCAREIAAKPPVAIWGTKQVIHYARDHSVDDSLKQMGWIQGAIWSNAHVREAVTAMKEKRAGTVPRPAAAGLVQGSFAAQVVQDDALLPRRADVRRQRHRMAGAERVDVQPAAARVARVHRRA